MTRAERNCAVTIRIPECLYNRPVLLSCEQPFILTAWPLQTKTTVETLITQRFSNLLAQAPQLCAAGCVTVNGEPCTMPTVLPEGAQLCIELPSHQEEPVDTRWELLWENDQLMAVFKPPLLPVSRTTRNLFNTLISMIRRQTPYYDARLLHRLDTETAGILLVAKDAEADRYWKPRLGQLMIRKLYRAEVSGVPSWDAIQADNYLATREHSPIRSQVYVAPSQAAVGYIKPKLASSKFRVTSRGPETSVLECELLTGRKHQIRAQLAALGHPIVGDKIYQHQGKYYLKRLQQPLSRQDFASLGGLYHRLVAVELTLDLAA